MQRLSALLLVCALFCASYARGGTYTGLVSYAPPPDSGDGIVTAGSLWSGYSPQLSWTVTDTDTTYAAYPWKYTYTFALGGTKSAVSHFVLEASDTFTASKITGLSGARIDSIGEQRVSSGNPGMPETVYGIRFDPLNSDTYTMNWSFYSSVAPVWGDFYAKGGNKGGVTNAAWNKGFTLNDVDPLSVASNGSQAFHILRPDTAGSVNIVPLPQAIYPGLVLLGVLCATKFLRRARD